MHFRNIPRTGISGVDLMGCSARVSVLGEVGLALEAHGIWPCGFMLVLDCQLWVSVFWIWMIISELGEEIDLYPSNHDLFFPKTEKILLYHLHWDNSLLTPLLFQGYTLLIFCYTLLK